MKKNLYLLLLLLFAGNFCYCQVDDINKIKKKLPLITDSLKYVDALNRLGMLMHERNVDSAYYYAKLSRAISGRLNYSKGEADALNIIGIVYDLRGNLQLSLRYYNDAFNRYKSLNDTENIIQVLMNIALVYNENNEDKKAIEKLQRIINLGAGLQKDSIMSLAYCNYLIFYPGSISKADAATYLNRAKQIAIKYNDERVLLVTDEIQAQFYINSGEMDKGISLLQKTLAASIQMQVNYVTVDILQKLGDLFVTTDSAKAITYYKQGLLIAELKDYHLYSKLIGKKLYDIYINQNNLHEVQRYSEKLLKLYNDEENFNNTSGFDYIDYALKYQQLQALTISAKNKKNLVFVFGILFVLTAITVIIVYRLYRLKRRHTQTLEKLNKTVQQRNEKLEIDHEFNNRLVSILAHDFRQPLGTLKTLATVLKDADSFTREELMDLVDNMEQSSNTSLEIFENILQWIKQQLSGFKYQPIPLSLRELINEAILPFEQLVDSYELILVNNIDPGIIINADKELVQFIHRNFIHNAIKFSPKGSTITIIGSSNDTETTLCVQDEGKGISPEKINSIFNFKADLKYSNEKEKGAGVALMICNDFIDKMKGRIWVENNQIKGACFSYSLPHIKKDKKSLFKIPVLAKAFAV